MLHHLDLDILTRVVGDIEVFLITISFLPNLLLTEYLCIFTSYCYCAKESSISLLSMAKQTPFHSSDSVCITYLKYFLVSDFLIGDTLWM